MSTASPTTAPGDLRRRERIARALLAPLLVAVLVGAAVAPWHSATSVDNRTYLEMIRGVVHQGLPYTINGPAQRFPELQARWNTLSRGRLWGALPPIFPYVAAPFFALGGARAVVRMNLALLAVLAVGAYALGRGVADDPLAGTATAYVTLLTAPLATVATDTSPYALALTCLVAAAAMAVASLNVTQRPASFRLAFSTGLLGGLSLGTHVLGFPVAVTLVAGLAVLPGAIDARTPRLLRIGPVGLRTPPRHALVRGAWALAGLAPPLGAVAAFNHLRFGSWNPISYGPCVWRSCAETGLDHQSLGAMLEFAAPVGAWVLGACAIAWMVRHSRVGLATVVTVSVVALVPPSVLHDRAMALAGMAWAFVVDMSTLAMGSFVRHPDGLGNFLGPYAVKSMLQSTPALALALLVDLGPSNARRDAARIVALASVALLASLALRANLPTSYALGFPFLNLRYVLPAMPLLAALAVAAVRELPWRGRHLAAGALVAAAVGAYLLHTNDDEPFPRRLILLRGTLVAAATAVVVVARARVPGASARWSHAAAYAAAATFALGLAVNTMVDVRGLIRLRADGDAYVARVGRQLPARFALVGWPPEIDPALSLLAERDIVYADLYESRNWANFRTLIDVWTAEGRPIYAIFPERNHVRSPWLDVRFEPLDPTLGLVRVRRF